MKVKTNQSKNYASAVQALEEEGFEYLGAFYEVFESGKQKEYKVFKKANKFYRFAGMDHFNTVIYWIELKPVKIDGLIR